MAGGFSGGAVTRRPPWYNPAMLTALAPRLARFSPAGLPPLRRLPFPALALAAGLLFAAVGVAVLDDYGVGLDAFAQRNIAIDNAGYITGDNPLRSELHHFYGVAFELPLLLVERILGLQDSRDILLLRHLLTHLFFIAGGFCCGLLAWRMFNNRWIALLAMLLFLLHPRLYAHSFFNSKDIPFTVMFVVALYLTHRAFRRDTLGAFVLLGIAVGLAVNLRPFALMFIAAVLALRGLDWRYAGDAARRRRIVVIAGVFAATTLAAIWASHPLYWENPLRMIEGFQTFSQHPVLISNLFRGQRFGSDAAPPEYIPVWFIITAPPTALLLGIAGIAAILWRARQAPGQLLRNGELRFRFLLLGCIALPIAAIVALESNVYDDWRHTYFLWGPFCLLAAACLDSRRFLPLCRRGISGKIRGGKLWRMAMGGVAAAGLGLVVYEMVSLHPNQQIYFNPLVNRAGSDELARNYDIDYWMIATRQGLEYLLQRYPDTTLYVRESVSTHHNRSILPEEERERIVLTDAWSPAFVVMEQVYDAPMRARMFQAEAVYERRMYNSAYLMVTSPRLAWGAGRQPGEEVYRAAYRQLIAAESLAARSDFEVYIGDGALYYVKDNCVPDDVEARFYVHLYPVNDDDLPAHRRQYGFAGWDFDFDTLGGFFDGKCITQEPLPDYLITRIRTGQHLVGRGPQLWQAEFPGNILQYRAAYESSRSGASGGYLAAAARGNFEVYFSENRLVYIKEQCSDADREARFYLHIIPQYAVDLPDNRESGFNNLDFGFAEMGVVLEGNCVAIAPLPDYPILHIRTGQFSGSGQLWRAELTGERLKYLATSEAIAVYSGREPAARSEWDVYIGDANRLVYLKESCAAADAGAKFYLHIIPQDVADLPGNRREIGFENRDFRFGDRGAMLAGRCAAAVGLPDYPIARIRTGQHIAGSGELWRADFAGAGR